MHFGRIRTLALTLVVAAAVFAVGVLVLSPLSHATIAGHACAARQMIVNECAVLDPSTIDEVYADGEGPARSSADARALLLTER